MQAPMILGDLLADRWQIARHQCYIRVALGFLLTFFLPPAIMHLSFGP